MKGFCSTILFVVTIFFVCTWKRSKGLGTTIGPPGWFKSTHENCHLRTHQAWISKIIHTGLFFGDRSGSCCPMLLLIIQWMLMRGFGGHFVYTVFLPDNPKRSGIFTPVRQMKVARGLEKSPLPSNAIACNNLLVCPVSHPNGQNMVEHLLNKNHGWNRPSGMYKNTKGPELKPGKKEK